MTAKASEAERSPLSDRNEHRTQSGPVRSTFALGAMPQARVSSGRKTINVGVMSAVGTKRTCG